MGISLLFEMLTSKWFEKIARLKETPVKVPIQLDEEEKKIWNTKEGVANISKEEYFLPSLIAKANLAPDIRQVCDLWPMEPPSILLICYRVIDHISVLHSLGTIYRCLVSWSMSSSNFSRGSSYYIFWAYEYQTVFLCFVPTQLTL